MAGPFDVYSLGGTQLIIPAGATNAVLITPERKETSAGYKMLSGTTLQVFGIPAHTANAYLYGLSYGSTWDGFSLIALNSSGGYPVGSGEAINIEGGTARFYFMATGSTAVVAKLTGYSQT